MPTKQSRKSVKPPTSIIGAGRLGTAIALGLKDRGYRIVALVGRNVPSKDAGLPLHTIRLSASQLDRLPKSELILICTPDDVIETVALDLATRQPQRGATVLHTSGALSSEILRPLSTAGFQVGSIHPLVSVSEPKQGVKSLIGANFCIEGDARALKLARNIVRDFGGQSFSIPSDKKSLYHAAAVMSAGHVVALFDLAAEVLARCGLKRAEAQKMLLPLVRSAVDNMQIKTPEDALTGPFSRGDVATVIEHVKALKDLDVAEAKSVYRSLGQRSLKLASDRSIKPAFKKELQRALDQLKE
jgi:predicted short-subunit dehydrogenase-like oxidoreductase (DUF2520 family)